MSKAKNNCGVTKSGIATETSRFLSEWFNRQAKKASPPTRTTATGPYFLPTKQASAVISDTTTSSDSDEKELSISITSGLEEEETRGDGDEINESPLFPSPETSTILSPVRRNRTQYSDGDGDTDADDISPIAKKKRMFFSRLFVVHSKKKNLTRVAKLLDRSCHTESGDMTLTQTPTLGMCPFFLLSCKHVNETLTLPQ